jgi:hypothetical protein
VREEREVDLAAVAVTIAFLALLAGNGCPAEPVAAAALLAVAYPVMLAALGTLLSMVLEGRGGGAALAAAVVLAVVLPGWLAVCHFLPAGRRPYSLVRCGGPEECRLLAEGMRVVVGQLLDVTLAALAALILVSLALSLLRRRKNPGDGAEHRALAA